MLLLSLLGAFQVAAVVPQANTAGPRTYNGRQSQTSVSIPRLSGTDSIDGKLDEPMWRQAALLTGFSEYTPVDSRPSPDSTEVLVWYSSDAIYFGIRAFETHGPVAVSLADRDHIASDDNVELQLDTFGERSRAFVFAVNPLGVQGDGTKNESGGYIPGANVAPGQLDLSADFIWQSKGIVTDWGYQVEARVPFSSLRYPVTGLQNWGFQVDRHVQHSGYEETWTPAVRANASFITQEGWLTGLSGMEHGQVVEVNPELTNTVNGNAAAAPATGWAYKSNPQLGGNVRWTLGSDFILNGTVKPDFSQVEADATQIAADQRFALFYPEKRPFFVDGAEEFNVPSTLVYTRRIVQPEAAAKVTGKLGLADVALLSAIDSKSASVSGSSPFVNILRIRDGFNGGESNAGFLYSDRVETKHENHLFDGDLHYVFGRLYYAQFQYAESMTRDSSVRKLGPYWEGTVDRTGRSYGFHYDITGVDSAFRAENGFVSRVGYVQGLFANRFTIYGNPGAFFERFNVFVSQTGLWRYPDFSKMHSVLEDHTQAMSQTTFRGGWQLGFTPVLSSYAFDPGSYAGYNSCEPSTLLSLTTGANCLTVSPFVVSRRTPTFTMNFSLATPIHPAYDASVSTTVGNDVDFLETSRVNRRDYNAALNLRPTNQLRIAATYLVSSFYRRSDGSRSFLTEIPRVKVEYQLTRSIFVRVVSQYQLIEREALMDPSNGFPLVTSQGTGSYAFVPVTNSNGLRTDLLFSYKPTPGTVFFLGYGSTMAEPDPGRFTDFARTTDGFFVKFSYLARSVLGGN